MLYRIPELCAAHILLTAVIPKHVSCWLFLLRVRWDQTGDVGTKIT